VIVTTTAVVTAEAVGWKLPPWIPPTVEPAGIFRVAGTVTEGRLLDKATVSPPVGTAAEKSIRQRIGVPTVIGEGGLQPKNVMLGRLEFPAGDVSVIDAACEEPL
jgi:hypothetical protein